MARHHPSHQKYRVKLPLSVRVDRISMIIQLAICHGRIKPATSSAIGLISFIASGMVVVTTAGILALHLN